MPTPRKFKDPRTLSTRCERELYDQVQTIASELRIDPAEFQRQAIIEKIERTLEPTSAATTKRKRKSGRRAAESTRGNLALVTKGIDAQEVLAKIAELVRLTPTASDDLAARASSEGVEKKGIEPSTSEAERHPVVLSIAPLAHSRPRRNKAAHAAEQLSLALPARVAATARGEVLALRMTRGEPDVRPAA